MIANQFAQNLETLLTKLLQNARLHLNVSKISFERRRWNNH